MKFLISIVINVFIQDIIPVLGSLPSDQCTSIGIGYLAMNDNSAIATHNDDCNECDIRVTHVPAYDWEKNSMRPIFATRPPYPRYLESPENNIHGPEYLVGTEDSSIYKWTEMKPVFSIPQVKHTYAYTLGNYPLQNEKQLSMGESTCAGRFFTTSAYVPAPNTGKARVDVNTMMEVAMERCDNSRCAIQTMGDLATTYGFYGSDPGNEGAGEAVTLADARGETWIFHVTADDTGTSAVWVAQRVPDDHITVVPNQFIIREIDLDNHDYFMASSNIFEVAIRNKLWDPSSGEKFNFLKIYGQDIGAEGFMVTRRTWRIFTLAAPSIQLNPLTDSVGSFGYGPDGKDPYPFSVKPDNKLSLVDVMKMTRDTYEGTPFDLSKGLAAGPFGDVMRYEAAPSTLDPVDGILYPNETEDALRPERAISLYRTVYASIAQARRDLPDVVGGVVWISPYAPHHSSYVPIYTSAEKTPSSVSKGTQYKISKSSNYWVHSVVGNYLSRWFKYTIEDVRALQSSIEQEIFKKQADMEAQAIALLKSSSTDSQSPTAASLIADFHEKTASSVRDQWWSFFWEMVSKYRDQMIVTNPHAPTYPAAVKWIMYPRWWLESIGFWGAPFTPAPGRTPVPVHPNGFPTLSSQEAYDAAYPTGVENAAYTNYCFETPTPSYFSTVLRYGAVFILGTLFTLLIQKFTSGGRKGYDPIADSGV